MDVRSYSKPTDTFYVYQLPPDRWSTISCDAVTECIPLDGDVVMDFNSVMYSDSPQVQCIQSYSSQEPDELSIEMADVLNLLERTDDGLYNASMITMKKLIFLL